MNTPDPSFDLRHSSKSLNEDFKDLINLVLEALPEFRFYDAKQIVVSVGASRSKGKGGIYAHIVPLRYQGGSYYRRGKRWGQRGLFFYDSPQIVKENPEALYMITFLMPKFFMVGARERLETIIHELYHIHPQFRGDLRKFPPPHVHHGPTPQKFQKKVEALTDSALKEMPFLIKHPLLALNVNILKDKKRRRYNMPRLRFVPQSTLFLVLFFFSLFASTLKASMPVQVKKSDYLRSLPQSSAGPSAQVVAGERLRALKQSADRKWVFLSNGSKGGWVPKENVQISAPSYKKTRRASRKNRSRANRGEPDDFLDDEFGDDMGTAMSSELGYDDEALPDEDFMDDTAMLEESALFVSAEDGKLYENPSKFSNRFSRVEKGDSLELIRKSESGKWTMVRLSVTGEEGWIPSSWMKRSNKQELVRDTKLSHTIEARLAFGPSPYGVGGNAAYYYTLWRGGDAAGPSRIDVGAQLHYYLGSTLHLNGQEIKVKYLSPAVLGRYVPSFKGGKYELLFEAGMVYHNATITTTLDKATVENSDLGLKEKDFMFVFGLGGAWTFKNHMMLTGGVHAFLKSTYSLFGFLGVGKRF